MAASIYDLDEAVIEKYDSYFALLDTSNQGILDYAQCTPLFEKANLPAHTLASVVALADADSDWRLDKKDFRIAMHLLYLAVQGHPVPTSVPAALAASARGADVGAPVDAEPSFGYSSFESNFSQQPSAMPAPPAEEAPSSSWAAGWNGPPQDASWSSGGQRPTGAEPPPSPRIYADEYHQPERRSSRHSCMSSHPEQWGGSSAPGAADLLSCSGLPPQSHAGPTSLPPVGSGSSEVGTPLDGEPSVGFSSFEDGNFTSELAAMPAAAWKEAPNNNWAAASSAPAQDSWSIGGQRPPGGEPLPSHAEGFHQSQRRNSRNSELAAMPSAPWKEAPNNNWAAASNAPAQDSWSIGGQRPPGGEPLPSHAEGFHQSQRRNSRNSELAAMPSAPWKEAPNNNWAAASNAPAQDSWSIGGQRPPGGEPLPSHAEGFHQSQRRNSRNSELAAMPSAPWKEAPNNNWAAASSALAQDSWSIGGQRPPGGEPLPSHAEGFHQSQRRNSRNSELAAMPSAPWKEAPNNNWAAASNAPAQDSWSIGDQRPPGGELFTHRIDAEGFHQSQRRNSRNSGLSVQPVPESGSVPTSHPAQLGACARGFEMDMPLDGEASFGFSSFESNAPQQPARMPAARCQEAPSSSCAATSNAAPQDIWSNGGQRFGGEAPLSQRAHAEGIPQMEMVNSKSIFLSNQSIPGASLPGEAAVDLLARSGLPLQDLDHIKRLADWDKDGSLSLDEFCIAMHLVARRKLGEPLINEERNLPSSLRPPLAWPHGGTSDAMHMPTVDTSGGQIGPSTGRLGMESGRNSLSRPSAAPSTLSQPPAPNAASPVRTIGDVAHTAQLVHSVVDSFNVNAAERANYEKIFRERLHAQNGLASAEEVHKFLKLSKQPTEVIDRVVRLSDVDHIESLSISEFCVAMKLVAECRKGKTLPNSLPAEVRDRLISSKTSEKAAAEEKAAIERRWKVSPEARLLYGSTFETTVGVDGTRMQRDRAMRHILRTGVAQTTVEDILRVVAPSGGRLDEGQFVIAMLLASRLAEGIPMPTPLPEELAQALSGRDEPPPAYNPEHNWGSNSPPKVPSPPSVPPADRPQPSVGALRRAESVQLSLEADLLSLERTPDVNLVAASKPEEVHASNLGYGEEAQLHEFFPVEGSGISAIAPLKSNDRPVTERAQPSAAIHAKENRDVNSERPVYWEHTQLRVAHEALHEAQMQLITRQHEASDISLRIAAVQAQRKAVQEEYAECVSRLRVVRGQCTEYSAQLETRRRELEAEQRELARAAADVKDSQTKAESYLSEAQALAHSLQVARDELRRLKQSHTSQLRAAHLSSRQLAPERSELAQLRAEIGVLKQQVEQAELMEMTAADASIMAASSAELKAALEEARLERQMLQDELQRERHERRQLEESAADVQTLTVMQDQLDRTHAEAEQIQAELQHLRTVAFAAVGTMEGGASAAESSLSLRALTPHPKRFSPTQPQHVQQQQRTPPTWSHSVDGSARHVDAGVEPLDRRFTCSLHRPVALSHNTADYQSSVAAHDRGRAFDGGPVRTTKHHHDLVDARHDEHTKPFMRQADTGEDNTAALLAQSESDNPCRDTSVQHGLNTNNDVNKANTNSSLWRPSSTDGRYAGRTNEPLHAYRGEVSKEGELAHAEVLGQQALQTLSAPAVENTRATEQMISPATSPQPIEGPSPTPGREMIDSEESVEEVQAMGKPSNANQTPGNQRSADQEAQLPTELDEVKKKRQAILADFEERASSIRGRSPLKELWLAVAEDGPREIKLAEKPELSREMLTWTPERQAAAIRLLCYQRSVNTVDLSGLAMGDLVAEAFAEVLRTNSTMLVLNIERNDFREAGLIAIAEALGENTTLQELRLAQQKMPVSFKAETVLGQVMAEKNNTLCKLGLALRDTNARTKVNSATSRNTDFLRLRRRASQKDLDNQPQTFSPREHSTKRLPIRGTPDEMSDDTAAGASKAGTKEAAFSPVASVIALEAPPFAADPAIFDAEASAAFTSTFDAEASSVHANNSSFGADNSMFGVGASAFESDFSAFDATASFGGADSSTFGAEASAFGTDASAFGTENSLFGDHTSAFDAGSAFGSTDAAGFGSTDAAGFGTSDAVTLGTEAPATGAELSAFGMDNEASTFEPNFSAFEVAEPAFGTEASDFPDEALAFPAAGFGTETSAFEADASGFGVDAFGAGAFGDEASEFDAGASGFGVDASGFGTDGSGFETSAPAFGADTPAFGEEASAFGTTFDTFGDQASTFGVTSDGFGNEGSLFETDGVSAFDADASSFGNEAFGETSLTPRAQVPTTHDGFGSTNDFGDGFSVEFADDGFGREGFEAPLTSATALPQAAPPDNGFPMSATATSQDVLEMAEFLEMKVDEDADLLWIARAALEGDDSLPDDHFKELYRKHREMKKLQQKVVFGSGPLGLELTQKGDQVVVTKVLPDTQAFSHHVKEGATIVAVNDIPMHEMSRDAVLQQIRIAPRPVQLTLMNSSTSAMQGSGDKLGDVPTTRWPEQTKALGEMGFTDAATVSMVLDETGGDVDAALTRLFQMG